MPSRYCSIHTLSHISDNLACNNAKYLNWQQINKSHDSQCIKHHNKIAYREVAASSTYLSLVTKHMDSADSDYIYQFLNHTHRHYYSHLMFWQFRKWQRHLHQQWFHLTSWNCKEQILTRHLPFVSEKEHFTLFTSL